MLCELVDGQLVAATGTGWEVLTDRRIGGSSTASFSVCHHGPDEVRWSLNISGELIPTIASPWAGIMFNPGPERLRAVDLSAWDGIQFAIRGDGRTCGLLVFLASRGRLGAPSVPVTSGPTWATHRFAWRDFDESDGHDVQGILVAATGSEGPFELQISDVRLWSGP